MAASSVARCSAGSRARRYDRSDADISRLRSHSLPTSCNGRIVASLIALRFSESNEFVQRTDGRRPSLVRPHAQRQRGSPPRSSPFPAPGRLRISDGTGHDETTELLRRTTDCRGSRRAAARNASRCQLQGSDAIELLGCAFGRVLPHLLVTNASPHLRAASASS